MICEDFLPAGNRRYIYSLRTGGSAMTALPVRDRHVRRSAGERVGSVCGIILLVALMAPGMFASPGGAAEGAPSAPGRVDVRVDAAAPGEALRHVWSHYGYDECNYTTTPGGRTLIETLAAINRDPVYLRQHFLLASGDGTPALKWGSTNAYTEDAQGQPVYDWRILDGIMDAVTRGGCRPLVEIGFMPRDLSVRPEPYVHMDTLGKIGKNAGVSYPPKDYDKWGGLIRAWASHSRDRYDGVEATWLWELWNEPDIFYWQGTFEEYCRLFDVTERAIHEVMPKARFGGPHTAGTGDFYRRFLEHCASGTNHATGGQGTRLDYIGFHAKGGTQFVDGHVRMNLGNNLRRNQSGFAIAAKFPPYRDTPIIIGECDPEGAAALSAKVQPANGYRNGGAYAAYEVALMKHTLDLAAREGVNLQGVLTWAFMFDGRESFEGFRTLATNGIHKPVLNAFKMLGQLEGRRVPVESSGALGLGRILDRGFRDAPDIDALACATSGAVQVLVWNYHDDLVAAEPARVRLIVRLRENSGPAARLSHWRIDDTHSNAYTRWRALGSPPQPSEAQQAELREAMELERLEPDRQVEVREGAVEIEFDLPRFGVSLVTMSR